MSATPKQLKAQYNRVKAAGWLPWFTEAAEKADTTTAHFLAIGSRETNLLNIKGDFRNGRYNGFGVMQVDVGTDPDYAANWKASEVEPSIRRGGEIYESKVDQIINGQGKSLAVKGKKFVGRKVELDDVRRIATSAYNCGLWAYFHFSNHSHVDLSTTGKDYSRDVYDRSLEFAKLLEADGDVGAYASEIQLQGKYATEEEKAKVKASLVTDTVTEPTLPAAEPPQSEETSGTMPPAAAEEVKASEVPFWTRITSLSIPAGVISALGGILTFAKDLPPYAWISFSLIVVAAMVIGFLIYRDGRNDAHERTKIVLGAAADPEKNNLRLV